MNLLLSENRPLLAPVAALNSVPNSDMLPPCASERCAGPGLCRIKQINKNESPLDQSERESLGCAAQNTARWHTGTLARTAWRAPPNGAALRRGKAQAPGILPPTAAPRPLPALLAWCRTKRLSRPAKASSRAADVHNAFNECRPGAPRGRRGRAALLSARLPLNPASSYVLARAC